jgi:hypothetical protein
MGLSDYRNPQMLKSEAKRIRESYGSLTNYEDLIKVVMGKETLKAVNNWLTEEYRKNISVDALLNEMKYEDVHEDMRLMLGHLQSKGINAVPTR